MGCFSVPHERKAKYRLPSSSSLSAKPHSLAAEMNWRSNCPSPASSSSRSQRDFDLGPPITRPSPLHSNSFKLTPLRSPAGASPLGRHHNSHRGHGQLVEDGTVGRCSSCGYGDERSPTTSFAVEKENEQGSSDAQLFPLPLPPASASVSSATSLNTCTDDASSHSVSSTGSGSSLSAPVPSSSISASSPAVNSKSSNYSMSLSSTADSHPLQRWHPSPMPLPPPPDSGEVLCMFSYEELAGACLNFATEFFIREGGAGPVFKASLKRAPEGGSIDVAITRLIRGQLHSFKRWRLEVGSLARLLHPHLCKVIGYSAEDPLIPPDKLPGFERERLLVYEHTANGSLESLLYCRKGRAPLDWGMRLKIAMGAAQGLAYLHDRVPRQIIYKSFKTINIQVDASFNAKLSDYGFARSCREQPMSSPAPSVSVNDAYAAPETHMCDEVSAKSNVWSFGIVLLELLTGRQNMDEFFPPEERNLLRWCRPYLLDSKRLYLIMDPELKGRYTTRMAKMLADLALQCLVEDPIARPSMRDVAASLCDLVGGSLGGGKVDCASDTIAANYAKSVNSANQKHLSNSVHGANGFKASLDGSGYSSSSYGSKFKLSKSYSLVSVLASPARVFVGGGGGNVNGEVHGHSQRARLRGFLSGEISKEACRSWARDHPGLSRSYGYGFLSGEIGVEQKGSGRLRLPFSQEDSYLPPPLGRSISSSSRHLTPITG